MARTTTSTAFLRGAASAGIVAGSLGKTLLDVAFALLSGRRLAFVDRMIISKAPTDHEGLTVPVPTHYMDEAERRHEIACIAYGALLARGTMDEVITPQN